LSPKSFEFLATLLISGNKQVYLLPTKYSESFRVFQARVLIHIIEVPNHCSSAFLDIFQGIDVDQFNILIKATIWMS